MHEIGPTPRTLTGIHHVTAICGAPQGNVDFYVGVLGLRLVKRTVNQDDPTTYHLFYGDALGHPGTELTFFAWPRGRHGRDGAGQAVAVSFAIPPASVDYWRRRLDAHRVTVVGPARRFDEEVLAFSDPDGLSVELVARDDAGRRDLWQAWDASPVPVESQIRGVHSVTIIETAAAPTTAFLTEQMGFRSIGDADGRVRFVTGDGGSGAILDLLIQPAAADGRAAVGSIHHVAWRTPDAAQQTQWWKGLSALGIGISSIIDRFWFKSIYFREPGGALFEIATDGPGFTADERPDELGSRLILAPWLERQRARIEAVLPPVHTPPGVRAPASSRSSQDAS
jgi:glyoxalase family protein